MRALSTLLLAAVLPWSVSACSPGSSSGSSHSSSGIAEQELAYQLLPRSWSYFRFAPLVLLFGSAVDPSTLGEGAIAVHVDKAPVAFKMVLDDAGLRLTLTLDAPPPVGSVVQVIVSAGVRGVAGETTPGQTFSKDVPVYLPIVETETAHSPPRIAIDPSGNPLVSAVDVSRTKDLDGLGGFARLDAYLANEPNFPQPTNISRWTTRTVQSVMFDAQGRMYFGYTTEGGSHPDGFWTHQTHFERLTFSSEHEGFPTGMEDLAPLDINPIYTIQDIRLMRRGDAVLLSQQATYSAQMYEWHDDTGGWTHSPNFVVNLAALSNFNVELDGETPTFIDRWVGGIQVSRLEGSGASIGNGTWSTGMQLLTPPGLELLSFSPPAIALGKLYFAYRNSPTASWQDSEIHVASAPLPSGDATLLGPGFPASTFPMRPDPVVAAGEDGSLFLAFVRDAAAGQEVVLMEWLGNEWATLPALPDPYAGQPIESLALAVDRWGLPVVAFGGGVLGGALRAYRANDRASVVTVF